MKQRIKISTKNRSKLQKEIKSICPFLCGSEDVEHFEIHHIDEDPSNNELTNLLLVCPTCHSKITKKDILRKEVEKIKNNLSMFNEIEIARITVDRFNCSWQSYDNLNYAFYDSEDGKSEFPILTISIINQTNRTILLTEIHFVANHLPSISGLPQTTILKSIARYKVRLPSEGETIKMQLENEIKIPPKDALKFQIEIVDYSLNKPTKIRGGKILKFKFLFSNKMEVIVPEIYLNCKNRNLEIMYVT